jgi:hypothetical protein
MINFKEDLGKNRMMNEFDDSGRKKTKNKNKKTP